MIKLATLGSSAAAIALVLGVASVFIAPQPAQADDCLRDTNNDGTATAAVDTDRSANSEGFDSLQDWRRWRAAPGR